jgi:hypothetical protein
MSKSKRRSLAAIGNSRVIPAKAGIQVNSSKSKRCSLAAIGNSRVIPAKAGIQVECVAIDFNLGPGLRRGDKSRYVI